MKSLRTQNWLQGLGSGVCGRSSQEGHTRERICTQKNVSRDSKMRTVLGLSSDSGGLEHQEIQWLDLLSAIW